MDFYSEEAHREWLEILHEFATIPSHTVYVAHLPTPEELEDIFRECVKGDPCGHCERCCL